MIHAAIIQGFVSYSQKFSNLSRSKLLLCRCRLCCGIWRTCQQNGKNFVAGESKCSKVDGEELVFNKSKNRTLLRTIKPALICFTFKTFGILCFMLEVLFFSLSISIDAFGLSLSTFGQHFKIRPLLFLALNVLNASLLSFFLLIFKNVSVLSTPTLSKLGDIFLVLFGLYYMISAAKKQNENLHSSNNYVVLKKKENLKVGDLLMLLYMFVFENIISAIIFYSNFDYPVFFVVSNFVLHAFFFMVGVAFGEKITKHIDVDSSFVSGAVFFALGAIELLN